jgi:hypothetical protein
MTPADLLLRQLTEARRDPDAAAYLRVLIEPRPEIRFQPADGDVWIIGHQTTAAGRNHEGLLLAWHAIDAALSAAQPTPWSMFYSVKRSASKGLKSAGCWVSSFCPTLGHVIQHCMHFRGDCLVFEPDPAMPRVDTRFLSGSFH